MMASYNNNPPIGQLLLDKGADVNAKNKVTLLLLYYNAINISYIIYINIWVSMDGLLLCWLAFIIAYLLFSFSLIRGLI